MCESVFAPLEGCLCFLGAVIMVLHLFLAQYFEPSIVYIVSFPAEILLWQCQKHCKANNEGFYILWHELVVLVPPLGVLVTVLDGCTVKTTWELLSLLRDAWGLSRERGLRCKHSTCCHELSSPGVINLILRRLIHQVPGGCARWWLGCSVFLNQQNVGYESKLGYLTSKTKKSQEFEYTYRFFPRTPPYSVSLVLKTPPASWTLLTSPDLHNAMPRIPKHTQ